MMALVMVAVVLAFTVGVADKMGEVDRVARAWERYARARGYAFRGAGLLRSSAALGVHAVVDGVEVRLALAGDEEALGTRVSARLLAHAARASDERAMVALDVLRARRAPAVAHDGGELQLSWDGAEQDEAILDAALRAAAGVCNARGAAGVYR